MKIIGLTGSIGMGKSTAAAMLRCMNVPVYSADEAVHRLLSAQGAAVGAVAKLYPAALNTDEQGHPFINRNVLGAAAFHDSVLMQQLEAILHPLVRIEEARFIKRARAQRKKCVVLDIPLLFETRGRDISRHYFDTILVVTAPAFIQAMRVLARPNMNAEKFQAILKKQMPDAQKRKRAGVIIHTGNGLAFTRAALQKILS